jgi:hypothetical protein
VTLLSRAGVAEYVRLCCFLEGAGVFKSTCDKGRPSESVGASISPLRRRRPTQSMYQRLQLADF